MMLPINHAKMRVEPADFVVEEIPSFDAGGEGEHLMLTIRKQRVTTQQVVSTLAKWARIAPMGVGYAGIKDKHGITTQRFTVHLPKKVAPDTNELNSDNIEVVDAVWHSRKLPRGVIIGNAFVITLREVEGDKEAIEERLEDIQRNGFPNVFGEQRFGRGDNVALALQMFRGKRVDRNLRSILLSAARSEIFNRIVQARTARGLYGTIQDGDVLMLEGTKSIFGPITVDDELTKRFEELDVVPTAPLWGEGELRSACEIKHLEESTVNDDAELTELAKGLIKARMKQERRAITAKANNLKWTWLDDTTLRLHFDLVPGAYATAMLSQLGKIEDVKRANAV